MALKRVKHLREQWERTPDYVRDDKGSIIGVRRLKNGVVVYTDEYQQKFDKQKSQEKSDENSKQ